MGEREVDSLDYEMKVVEDLGHSRQLGERPSRSTSFNLLKIEEISLPFFVH